MKTFQRYRIYTKNILNVKDSIQSFRTVLKMSISQNYEFCNDWTQKPISILEEKNMGSIVKISFTKLHQCSLCFAMVQMHHDFGMSESDIA